MDNNRDERKYLNLFLDCLDFSDPAPSSSWTSLIYLSMFERDDFYIARNLNEVCAKTDSTCAWLVKHFLSDIARNMTYRSLGLIWIAAGSPLFLIWLTNIIQSTDLHICKNIGYSFKSWLLSNSIHELTKAKLKLLFQMGINSHFAEYYNLEVATTTTYLILNPISLQL